MSLFATLAALLTVTAAFAYVNYRTLRLPTTIGVMLIALGARSCCSRCRPSASASTSRPRELARGASTSTRPCSRGCSASCCSPARSTSTSGDLRRAQGDDRRAGDRRRRALHRRRRRADVPGGCGALGLELPLIDCLLFGALISPTDPIAVMGILKRSARRRAGDEDRRRVAVQRRRGRGGLPDPAGASARGAETGDGRRGRGALLAAGGRRRRRCSASHGLRRLPDAAVGSTTTRSRCWSRWRSSRAATRWPARSTSRRRSRSSSPGCSSATRAARSP